MWTTRGSSRVEGVLIDWACTRPESDPKPPVLWLGDEEVAAELGRIQRNRARETAREAELILRLAELRPDADDPPASAPGARRTWRRSDPEFSGVSEFFPDEVAHAINLGRGTAAFRARRAFTWVERLPATFAALRCGRIDERRAGVLADALQYSAPELAQAVEATVLPGAEQLSLSALRDQALQRLAELDADASDVRHEQARRSADVRVYPAGDSMGSLSGELPVEEAAACYAVIDQLATMARADGDDRPIGAIRTAIMSMLILRPADHGLPGVTVQLAVAANLEGVEGRSSTGGEVNGQAISVDRLRDLLRRVGALGLTTPEGGSLTFALTDEQGRLLATLTAAELARLAKNGCPQHPDPQQPGCDCPLAGMPPPSDGYPPTAAQERFVSTRDRRCRMPNCGQRAGRADHDHVIPHAAGGATTCTNLCCLCRSHHRLKTFVTGWTFRLAPDGTLHVTSPSGVTRTTRPPGLRPPHLGAPEPEPSPSGATDEPADDPPPF